MGFLFGLDVAPLIVCDGRYIILLKIIINSREVVEERARDTDYKLTVRVGDPTRTQTKVGEGSFISHRQYSVRRIILLGIYLDQCA
jgi:hypothetical protein